MAQLETAEYAQILQALMSAKPIFNGSQLSSEIDQAIAIMKSIGKDKSPQQPTGESRVSITRTISQEELKKMHELFKMFHLD